MFSMQTLDILKYPKQISHLFKWKQNFLGTKFENCLKELDKLSLATTKNVILLILYLSSAQ